MMYQGVSPLLLSTLSSPRCFRRAVVAWTDWCLLRNLGPTLSKEPPRGRGFLTSEPCFRIFGPQTRRMGVSSPGPNTCFFRLLFIAEAGACDHVMVFFGNTTCNELRLVINLCKRTLAFAPRAGAMLPHSLTKMDAVDEERGYMHDKQMCKQRCRCSKPRALSSTPRTAEKKTPTATFLPLRFCQARWRRRLAWSTTADPAATKADDRQGTARRRSSCACATLSRDRAGCRRVSCSASAWSICSCSPGRSQSARCSSSRRAAGRRRFVSLHTHIRMTCLMCLTEMQAHSRRRGEGTEIRSSIECAWARTRCVYPRRRRWRPGRGSCLPCAAPVCGRRTRSASVATRPSPG